jgi:D-alanyl-D-alanine dipeptidase
LLSAQAATALAEVQRSLAAARTGLKCSTAIGATGGRTFRALGAQDRRREAQVRVYPELDKRVLFEQGYIAEHSGHSRGATVDLTLVRRADGSEVDVWWSVRLL